jgi:cell division protein FtsW
MGLVPTKGLALPFLSFGGSSLLVNCAAIGVLLNVSRARAEAAQAPRESGGEPARNTTSRGLRNGSLRPAGAAGATS